MITRDEAAAKLNGREYGREGDQTLWDELKESGLVAIFGYSDDGAEWRGAIYEETFSEEIRVTNKGIPESKCSCDDCPYFETLVKGAAIIRPIWERDDISWQFETSIPHATFDIMEDGDIYCRGIVFKLADAPEIGI